MQDDKFSEDDDLDSVSDFDLDDEDEDFEEGTDDEDIEETMQSVGEEDEVPPLLTPEESRTIPHASSKTPENQGLISPADIPIVLKIELGRIAMTADRLLHLQAGNFLELGRTIDQDVDLVVNGARVGRGELIRIGEAVGVRVKELG